MYTASVRSPTVYLDTPYQPAAVFRSFSSLKNEQQWFKTKYFIVGLLLAFYLQNMKKDNFSFFIEYLLNSECLFSNKYAADTINMNQRYVCLFPTALLSICC